MSNTYTQIHLHFIYAPKFRASLIQSDWETELYKYITGIVQMNKHKMVSINGMPDHIHMLIGFRPTQSISDFMQSVKSGSSRYINDNRLCNRRFEWQSGYGAFSHSRSQINNVIDYIENQKSHHMRNSFLDEYRLLLSDFGVDYNEKYIFEDPI
jgi:putative transposase